MKMSENNRKISLSTLNPQQEEAVAAMDGPLLVVAGAGTGKTRTLTSRLARFADRGIPPERICAITFTNKAAREMLSRVGTMTSDNDDDKGHAGHGYSHGHGHGHSHYYGHRGGTPFIGTFHALGARILRREARLLGRGANFTIFDSQDSFGLIKKIIKRRLVSSKRGDGDDRSRSLKNLEKPALFAQKISEIKSTSPAIADPKKSGGEMDRLVLEIFQKYENALAENNAFDFDDLIEKPVYLFKKHPEVLKKHRSKFDAILVDEYQDLNPKQYELIKCLAGGHKNLSVVGDDEQMIYGWRHANLGTFLNFEKDWPGAQVKFLEENYRSTQNIIGAASAVAQNNQYRRPKNLWTKNPSGELIRIIGVEDENEEAEYITKQISNSQFLISKGSTAVLYRTNAQSRAIEQALIRNKIPYHIFGGLKFYERKEIKDIVAAMRYAMNGKDEISRDRLEKNLGKRRFQEFAEAAARISGAEKLAPVKLIEKFLKITDYLEYLERTSLNYDERKENVAELIDFASRFAEPQSFLEEVALVQATDLPSAGTMTMTNDNDKKSVGGHGQVVHLSTIHLAKGLEFDRVFIAGCSEGLLPHARSLANEYQLEEERRLMYVAMTRARKELAISFYDLPSRFLGEIPPELTEAELAASAKENADEERCVVLD